MPDADDFDVEELRRLMRGEAPRPAQPAPAGGTTPRKSGSGRTKSGPVPTKGARPAAGAKRTARPGRKQP